MSIEHQHKCLIIGGGAAGYFAAIQAKLHNPLLHVTILEATSRVLTKVKISGGGRCNVTHSCFEPKELVKNYPRGSQELLGPFHKFSPQDTIEFFKERGVTLKTEADGRMFPTTDTSQTIIDCFEEEIKRLEITILKSQLVAKVIHDENGFKIFTKKSCYRSQFLILATGSMPKGFEIAKELNHTVTPLIPSLFTFHIECELLKNNPGISLPHVEVLLTTGNIKKQGSGSILTTHWGLSGPAIIKLSAFMAEPLFLNNYQASLSINWIPSEKTEALISKINELKTTKKQILSTPLFNLPKRLWQIILVPYKDRFWNSLNSKDTQKICDLLKSYPLNMSGKSTYKKEFVTCGGVSLKEINFQTMESKLTPGLYFAGEILNIDGITGGFNFQNAWTTAYLAGKAIAATSKA